MDITVRLSGDRTKTDRDVALRFGQQINQERTDAAGSPDAPGYVAPVLLPLETNPQIYAAYEIYLSQLLTRAHDSYIEQQAELDVDPREFRQWWKTASDADKTTFKTLSGL